MIEKLTEELRKDKAPGSLYHGYQCNIAMAFIEEYWSNTPRWRRMKQDRLHRIANDAAIRFLDRLCWSDVGSEKAREQG